ncbi:CRISPR-associated protein Cmr4 [Paenibacillus shirakamiensis]|uniref:CRISPR-associated protein Cmr4 n=1 Tax=Paenibacillus shirakamiensis TaxID=1265935 RepID=A0ABS4JBK0_9BACL|nr:type III-B CRISPR module RAMP protein Cmr4 [Paenibacillus shirakamiensis]MBP1999089.1 CRISPR-associated protein Cmr4 [Paenibacillus shirakamiensis]
MEQVQRSQVSRWLWMHCLSPLHIGSGEGLGNIDMPIQREKVTEWPFIPGSSLKGAQRGYYRSAQWLDAAFGQQGEVEGNAGALVFTDGRLLAFPVASRFGIFAYVTCPLVLKRFQRDAVASGLPMTLPDMTRFEQEATVQPQLAWVSDTGLLHPNVGRDADNLFLDEFTGNGIRAQSLADWAQMMGQQLFEDKPSQELWQKRVVLVSDETFQYFAAMCCEVVPRIRMNEDTKTVQHGALWYEEYVPTEAVFYALIWCDRVGGSSSTIGRDQFLDQLERETVLHMGGNITLGKGRIRCRITGGRS